MGQKVRPTALRLGYNQPWLSNWWVKDKKLAPFILEDYRIRQYLYRRFPDSGITSIAIDRLADRLHIKIQASRPGLIIGRKGSEINLVNKDLAKICGKTATIDVAEVSRPSVNAAFMSANVAQQLKRRGSFRFICKRAVETAMQHGALGIKIQVSGRLGGAEISRSEKFKEGKIPLHTFSAIIDYGQTTAFTTYGTIGVKVWIYRGDSKEKV